MDWSGSFAWGRWALVGPSGDVVVEDYYNDRMLSLPAGDYVLRVISRDDRFGSYQLQVSESS